MRPPKDEKDCSHSRFLILLKIDAAAAKMLVNNESLVVALALSSENRNSDRTFKNASLISACSLGLASWPSTLKFLKMKVRYFLTEIARDWRDYF